MSSTRRKARSPVLPVPMPTCDVCNETVDARLCQAWPRTDEDVKAIQAVLLAAHKRLVHEDRPR